MKSRKSLWLVIFAGVILLACGESEHYAPTSSHALKVRTAIDPYAMEALLRRVAADSALHEVSYGSNSQFLNRDGRMIFLAKDRSSQRFIMVNNVVARDCIKITSDLKADNLAAEAVVYKIATALSKEQNIDLDVFNGTACSDK